MNFMFYFSPEHTTGILCRDENVSRVCGLKNLFHIVIEYLIWEKVYWAIETTESRRGEETLGLRKYTKGGWDFERWRYLPKCGCDRISRRYEILIIITTGNNGFQWSSKDSS